MRSNRCICVNCDENECFEKLYCFGFLGQARSWDRPFKILCDQARSWDRPALGTGPLLGQAPSWEHFMKSSKHISITMHGRYSFVIKEFRLPSVTRLAKEAKEAKRAKDIMTDVSDIKAKRAKLAKEAKEANEASEAAEANEEDKEAKEANEAAEAADAADNAKKGKCQTTISDFFDIAIYRPSLTLDLRFGP